MFEDENNHINFENSDVFEVNSEDLSTENKQNEKSKNKYANEVQCDEEMVNKLSILGSLTLASDDITQSYSRIGKEFYLHIFLKDISSIQLGYKSYPIFVILALIALVVAVFNVNNYDALVSIAAFVLFVVFLLIFFVTRKHTLIITAKGGEKMYETVGAGENTKTFVERIIYLSRHKKHPDM